jgi:hypothetical protein
VIIAIFSIGQFIGSDLGRLKKGFQQWFEEHTRAVTGDNVWDWMVKNLKPLRVNEITLEKFCEQFNAQFNSNPDAVKMPYPVFEAIFKSMATIDEDSLRAITQFVKFLDAQQGNVKCLLVSHTNICQFEHILSQLKGIHYNVLDGNKLGFPEEHLLFATSMHSNAELHPQTLAYALSQLDLSLVESDVHFVSFLNTIVSSEYIQYMNPYVGADKKLNIPHVISLISEMQLKLEEQRLAKEMLIRKPMLDAIELFEKKLKEHYQDAPPLGTDKFCAQARKICNETRIDTDEGEQNKYNARACRKIARLAQYSFGHRDFVLRLLADIVFIPLGFITLGAGFALKANLTGSATFLGAKTHRQELLDECLEDVKNLSLS